MLLFVLRWGGLRSSFPKTKVNKPREGGKGSFLSGGAAPRLYVYCICCSPVCMEFPLTLRSSG